MGQERTIRERIEDSVKRFETDVDCFVATTSTGGRPNVAPLSVLWHGDVFFICTRRSTHTVKNLETQPLARLVYGSTRDVVIADVSVEIREITDVDDSALAAEEPERNLMQNGRWLEQP
ncbi:MAG: hypothetical protein QOF68_2042 [Gaiellales bacterium]|nr:hypothetical protein [Gaiellales bacterium]